MPIRAIAYTSNASPGLSLASVQDFVRKAAAFNMQAGVTGVLLFDGERFFQYIEGPEDGLSVAFARVIHSEAHTDITELGRARTGGRHFPYWSMRVLSTDERDISKLVASAWDSFALRPVRDEQTLPTGVEELSQIVLPHVVGGLSISVPSQP